ncbi:hypothetical protein QE385_000206 [Sphingomonas sp. SORGH_AS 950]|uniref:S41 family peptidase n=1 Tax=Sphingomonas sp. SORGH_AS_0950 TaxID=3041792 RepID=UPI002788EC0C|nr:S41 family peptidase [Sphingomonas sp. SORGH_AS_0950]MDQ1155879.1 hypothetical protein [Sphingomonas sp. SORGH_AS_0950]
MKARVAANERHLYDLDHLLREMGRSFTQIYHARRKFGVDIVRQAESLAATIAAADRAYDAHEFHALLDRFIFTPGVQRAGSRSWHAMPSNVGVLPREFYFEFFLRTRSAVGGYDAYVGDLLKRPEVIEFYTGIQDGPDRIEEIGCLALQSRQRLYERPSHGRLPTVTTDIPIAGKVARVAIDNMGPNMAQYPDFYSALEERLFDFYQTIATFGHLIFDVRGNPGGFTPFVERMLVGPHLSAPVELSGFVLFPRYDAGDHVHLCTETFYPMDRYPRIDLSTMVGRGMLPALDADDEAMLDAGAYNHWMTFSPTIRRSPFAGKIWILIDEVTGSASEVLAILARQVGIAQIVGEQSAGNHSKSRGQGSLLFIALPYSGMVVTWDPVYFTDAAGRHAHEHHVLPDHENRLGLDALQTTLAIILESEG